MQSDGNKTETIFRGGGHEREQSDPAMKLTPFLGLVPISNEIIGNADRLSEAELVQIAGHLRGLADEAMGIVHRRLGIRPRPRLVVDNTRQEAEKAAGWSHLLDAQ